MSQKALFRLLRASGLLCFIYMGLPVVAQSVQTANQTLRLKGYGLASSVNPGYGPDTRNLGVTFGLNLDSYRLIPQVDIGLDVRLVGSYGDYLNEYVFSNGPRISYNKYRLKPYGDFLVGGGVCKFRKPENPTYTKDASFVKEFGGGFDYGITHYWSLRVDAQRQRWGFSKSQPYFYPVQIGVGVAYQIHPPSRTGPRD